MGIQGSTGEVLAGDPIPAAPGTTTGANFFSGEGNTAVIGDGANLWDPLIVEPETIYVQEPTPEPEVTEPEEPEVLNPTTAEGAYALDPIDENASTPEQPVTTPTTSTTSTTAPSQTVVKEEQSRDEGGTIVVTKTVEVIEYDQATTADPPTNVESEKSGSNNTMMIIIVASIVGVLFVLIIAMVARMVINRRKGWHGIPRRVIGEVKTGVVDVEPQFVLAPDDSKNIFGRPSTAPLGEDAIERSENKKPGAGDSKRRTKKTVVRKVKDPRRASGEERKAGEDSDDDGFRNYEQHSPSKTTDSVLHDASPSKVFNASSRSSSRLFDPQGSVSTTRKLKTIALRKIEDDDEE